MAKTYADLLQETKGQIKQVSLEDLNTRIQAGEKITLVDVREKDEWRQGYIPDAVHLPGIFVQHVMCARARMMQSSPITTFLRKEKCVSRWAE